MVPTGRARTLIAILCGVCVGGCDGPAPEPFSDPPAIALSGSVSDTTVRIGLDEAGPAETLFRFIHDAAFGHDGSIGVIAYDPPYVRVFSADGGFRWSALEDGDGPDESRGPFAIAASRDGFLVLSLQRIHALDYNGRVLFERRLTSVSAHDVGPGCDTRSWTLYGEGREDEAEGRVGWLFRVSPRGESIEPIFHDRVADAPQRKHRVSIRRVGSGIRFDHPYGRHRGLIEYDCASGSAEVVGPTVLEQRFFSRSGDPRRAPRLESVGISEGAILGRRRYDLPEPVYGGYAFAVDGPPYVPSYRGWFTTRRDGEWVSAATAYDGRILRLLDHDDSVAILKGRDPVPHVYLLEMPDLRKYLRALLVGPRG